MKADQTKPVFNLMAAAPWAESVGLNLFCQRTVRLSADHSLSHSVRLSACHTSFLHVLQDSFPEAPFSEDCLFPKPRRTLCASTRFKFHRRNSTPFHRTQFEIKSIYVGGGTCVANFGTQKNSEPQLQWWPKNYRKLLKILLVKKKIKYSILSWDTQLWIRFMTCLSSTSLQL